VSPTALTDPDDAIANLPGWSVEDGHFVRKFEAPDFLTAVAWVVAVADLAEEMDHHPDIDIRWRRVTLRLRTHSADALTDLDLDLATRIQALLGQLGES
jgi:4a-hydroxytetrahydrobiopterin dehydratase